MNPQQQERMRAGDRRVLTLESALREIICLCEDADDDKTTEAMAQVEIVARDALWPKTLGPQGPGEEVANMRAAGESPDGVEGRETCVAPSSPEEPNHEGDEGGATRPGAAEVPSGSRSGDCPVSGSTFSPEDHEAVVRAMFGDEAEATVAIDEDSPIRTVARGRRPTETRLVRTTDDPLEMLRFIVADARDEGRADCRDSVDEMHIEHARQIVALPQRAAVVIDDARSRHIVKKWSEQIACTAPEAFDYRIDQIAWELRRLIAGATTEQASPGVISAVVPLDLRLAAQAFTNEHAQCDSTRRERADLETLLVRVRAETIEACALECNDVLGEALSHEIELSDPITRTSARAGCGR